MTPSTPPIPDPPRYLSRRALLSAGGTLAGSLLLAACGGATRDDAGSPTSLAKLTAPSPATTSSASSAAGGSTASAAGSSAYAGSATTSAVAPELSGEVVIWDREGDLFKVFDNAIKGFQAKHPKVTVKHQSVDVAAKLPTSLITGTNVPDGSFWEDVNIQGSAANLTDVSELLKPYLADTIKYKIDVNTIDGRTVGVPWDLDPGMLFYRVDHLEQAGVDPDTIATYQDLTAAATKIKAKNPNAKPIRLEGDEGLSQLLLEMFANQMGTSMVDESGKLQLNTDQYKTILGWQRDVMDKGLATIEKLHSPADIANLDGDVNSLVPFAIWFDYAPQMMYKKSKGLWRAAQLPAWTAGGARSGVMGGSSFVIPAKAKRPDLAWAVFEYIVYSKEGYTSVYGPNAVYPTGLNTSLPSYKPALDPATPLFKPVAALGNQDLWKVATTAAAQVPAGYRLSPWYNQAIKYLGANIQKMLKGQLSVDDCLKTSADQIQKNLIDRR